jgi:hypothetical protein
VVQTKSYVSHVGLAPLRLRLLGVSALYVFLLHLAYVYLVSPNFSYMRLTYAPKSLWVVIWSVILALIPTVWMPLRLHRPSLVVFSILYLFVVVPICIVPAYIGQLEPLELLKLQLAILLGFALLGVFYGLPLLQAPRIRLSQSQLLLGVSAFAVICYGVILGITGFRLRMPNPLNVYDIRADYNDLAAGRSFIFGYAMSWQISVINPFFIARGLVSKNLVLVVIGVLGELLVYSITGMKDALFSGGWCLLLLLVSKKSRNVVLGITSVMAGVVALSIGLDTLTHTYMFSAMFVRRMIFDPGLLTSLYFDFFSNNPHLLLGHSILKNVVDYPYTLDPAYLIGALYFGHDDLSANANLWADGYSNFGYIGIYGVSLVLGTVLWLIDSFAQNTDARLVMILVGIPSLVLANTALLTSLATHGLVLTIFLVYLMPKEKSVSCERMGFLPAHPVSPVE